MVTGVAGYWGRWLLGRMVTGMGGFFLFVGFLFIWNEGVDRKDFFIIKECVLIWMIRIGF